MRRSVRSYALPALTPLERRLLRGISGSTSNPAGWKVFSNGEAYVHVTKVEKDVVVIGRFTPGNDDVWRTLLLVDTLRRNGAERVTLLVPYFAYARQDRMLKPGDPLSAACLLKLCAAAGATRIVTADLHSSRVAVRSRIPIISVPVLVSLAQALRTKVRGSLIQVAAPDRGSFDRAVAFAKALGSKLPVLWIEKERVSSGVKARRLHGTPAAEAVALVDDMVDTGGTVLEAAKLLRRSGVKRLHLCATHGIFSGPAAGKIRAARFESVLVGDTMPLSPTMRRLRVETRSSAPALLRALKLHPHP